MEQLTAPKKRWVDDPPRTKDAEAPTQLDDIWQEANEKDDAAASVDGRERSPRRREPEPKQDV